MSSRSNLCKLLASRPAWDESRWKIRSVPGHRGHHFYDAAISAFEAAEQLLGDGSEDLDEEQSDLWLEVQVDGRANLHYWWNEPERGAEVLAKARPVVEAEGRPSAKPAFT